MSYRSARSAAASTALAAFATILLLSNCTSATKAVTTTTEKDRSVASLADSPDQSALAVVSSPDPKAELAQRLDKYTRIYYRAQAYLADFDKKLDEAIAHPQPNGTSSLFSEASPTGAPYARLVAAWMLSEKVKSQLSQAYLGAANAEIAALNGVASDSAQQTAKVKQFAAEYTKALNKSGAQRIALQGVYEEIASTSDQLDALLAQSATNYAGLNIKEVSHGAIDLVLGESNTAAYYQKYQSELDAQAAKSVDDEQITQEIESLVPGVVAGLSAHEMDRQPQSAGMIRPDSGPAGNVSGSQFPRGTWALTFDDGPARKFTPTVLQNLKSHGLKATFFMLAQMAARAPEQVANEKAAGMNQGNHSYNHPNLAKLGESQLQFQIVKSTQDLAGLIGSSPKLFRCPYGSCGSNGSRVRQLIAAQHMVHIFWTVDSLDWQDHNPASIFNRVKKQMAQQGRGIILFHDIHPQSVAASKLVMDDFVQQIQAKTLRSVTVQQGIDGVNGK